MNLSRILGRVASCPARHPAPRRSLRVEPLEGRQLQSGIAGVAANTPAIVGGQGGMMAPDCGVIRCGGHIGTS
jgi:hypothetical protein